MASFWKGNVQPARIERIYVHFSIFVEYMPSAITAAAKNIVAEAIIIPMESVCESKVRVLEELSFRVCPLPRANSKFNNNH